jgi:hypothetical protein
MIMPTKINTKPRGQNQNRTKKPKTKEMQAGVVFVATLLLAISPPHLSQDNVLILPLSDTLVIRLDEQCLHLTASARISSAQNGHFFVD